VLTQALALGSLALGRMVQRRMKLWRMSLSSKTFSRMTLSRMTFGRRTILTGNRKDTSSLQNLSVFLKIRLHKVLKYRPLVLAMKLLIINDMKYLNLSFETTACDGGQVHFAKEVIFDPELEDPEDPETIEFQIREWNRNENCSCGCHRCKAKGIKKHKK
jgi:hypothetical protein